MLAQGYKVLRGSVCQCPWAGVRRVREMGLLEARKAL